MNHHTRRLALGLGLGLVGALVACSSKVLITAESSSGSSSSGLPGGTGGTSSGSGSSGTGATVSGKVVTADNDIGQYASFTFMPPPPPNPATPQKVVDGPFFVTDVYQCNTLDTVAGGDCSVPQSQHTPVLNGGASSNAQPQWHGMKLPVVAGQTLCVTDATYPCTVLGFRPY